jgi:hypothetical protein
MWKMINANRILVGKPERKAPPRKLRSRSLAV